MTNEKLEEAKIENLFDEDYWGLGVNYDFDFADWWELSAYANVKYRSVRGCKPEFGFKGLSKWGSEFNLTSDTYLNHDQTIYLEIYVSHDFPTIGFEGNENHNMGTFDISLNFDLLDGNLTFSAYACDIFNQNFSDYTIYYDTFEYKSKYFPFSHSFGIYASYRFGKTSMRDVRKRLKDNIEGRNQ